MARILVVDDDLEIRRLVTRMFQIRGHEVDAAGDGAEALQMVDEQAYDLVVSDIRMPVMDGVALLQALRVQEQTMPFVFISGHACAGSEPSLMADAFVTKPFTFDELTGVVDDVLSRVAV